MSDDFQHQFGYEVFTWMGQNLTTITVVFGIKVPFVLLKLKICSLYHENLLLQKFNDMYTHALKFFSASDIIEAVSISMV